jgi:hypothetical protein
MKAKEQTTEDLRRLVERVVREVVVGERAGVGKGTESEPQETTKIHAFDGTVLTAKIAEQYPRNQTLHIGPRAVMTPSALEILKDRRIRWVRGTVASNSQGTLVADADGLRRCATLSRQLSGRGYEGIRGCGLKDLIARVKEESKNHSPLVHLVIAQSPQAAVWNIYQASVACAVQVSTTDDPLEIITNVRPRVWILDARRLTVGALVQLADRCLMASASVLHHALQNGGAG